MKWLVSGYMSGIQYPAVSSPSETPTSITTGYWCLRKYFIIIIIQ
jgi:hypothetical protein